MGDGINSPQPSMAWPPMVAAWFLRHSLYVTTSGDAGWWRLRGLWRLRIPLVRGGGRCLVVDCGCSESGSGVLTVVVVATVVVMMDCGGGGVGMISMSFWLREMN